jgi:3-dehydroquinate synthase
VQQLTIDLGPRSYPIYIGERLLADAGLLSTIRARSLLVVTDETVASLYLDPVLASLRGFRIATLILPPGEQHKSLATTARVFDALAGAKIHRDGAIVALGGGVIGDIAGFAAACYQRGIAFVQVPTTLLAQVDSSVGGKTGVNHPAGKNLIGAFHQPAAVFIDPATLRTLPPRELRAGLAEVIKYGLICDEAFLRWLEDHLLGLLACDIDTLTVAIRRSCEIKAQLVMKDEREHGDRAFLNFGHTFGHALEAATGFSEWLHGEAVGVGMLMAATLSQRLGWLTGGDVGRLRQLLERAALPVAPPVTTAARMLELMKLDKKVRNDRVRLVLLRRLGEATVAEDYDPKALQGMLVEFLGS